MVFMAWVMIVWALVTAVFTVLFLTGAILHVFAALLALFIFALFTVFVLFAFLTA